MVNTDILVELKYSWRREQGSNILLNVRFGGWAGLKYIKSIITEKKIDFSVLLLYYPFQ